MSKPDTAAKKNLTEDATLQEPPQQRALLLLSGGFDSTVAGNRLVQLGWQVDALHFSGEPVVPDISARVAELATHIPASRMWVATLGPAQAKIVERCFRRFYYVILRCLMMRIAAGLARRESISALATGDNLGQVGSQTVENMFCIDEAAASAGVRVLRPVLSWDKVDIIRQAQRIGTYELSSAPEMCNALGPKDPKTRSRLDKVLREEARLDMDALVAGALEAMRAQGLAAPSH